MFPHQRRLVVVQVVWVWNLDILLEQLLKLRVLKALLQVGVVSIFDLIISAARDISGHLTPARIKFHEKLNDYEILSQGPLFLHNMWVQMMVPALTTLLANTPWK